MVPSSPFTVAGARSRLETAAVRLETTAAPASGALSRPGGTLHLDEVQVPEHAVPEEFAVQEPDALVAVLNVPWIVIDRPMLEVKEFWMENCRLVMGQPLGEMTVTPPE
jgi:hypothetical protein